MPESGSTNGVVLRRVDAVVLALALAAGVVAALAMEPRRAGLVHDDAIYLSVAQSLAEGRGYRLANLPTTPVQTKYPPLYSGYQSLVWRVAPPYPANLPWLKAINAITLVAIVCLLSLWYRRRFGRADVWHLPFLALTAMSPWLLPYVDYTLTDLPFFALCLGALCLADEPRAVEGAVGAAGRPAKGWVVGIVVGAAFLVRQAALPLAAAVAVVWLARRRWRPFAEFATVFTALVTPWLVFKILHAPETVPAALRYYVGYEPSIPQLALTQGVEALGRMLDNVVYVGITLDQALLLPAAPALRALAYPLIAVGILRHLGRPWGLLHAFFGLYLVLIVLWPWHPGRYAIPFVPLLPLALVLGTRDTARFLSRAMPRGPVAALAGGVTALPLVALLMIGVRSTDAFVRPEPDRIRLWYTIQLSYGWDGFDETFAWIRENTPEDAILASAFDPLYYLETGRRGVRPWFHRPWTYFYPRGRAIPDLGTPGEVRTALDEIGVRYFVVDPMEAFNEVFTATGLFERTLASYRTPEYDGPPVLRFTSSDSLHRVYELPRRRNRRRETSGGGVP